MAAKPQPVKSSPFTHSHLEVQGQNYVVFADNNRRYIDCSDGVCELLGYTKSEVLSKTIEDLSYITADVPAVFDRFVKHGALDGQYLLRHKNGQSVSMTYKAWVFADGCLAAAWQPVERWKQLYHKALLEVDPDRLRTACTDALKAIEDYARECEKNGTSSNELPNAARTLRLFLNK